MELFPPGDKYLSQKLSKFACQEDKLKGAQRELGSCELNETEEPENDSLFLYEEANVFNSSKVPLPEQPHGSATYEVIACWKGFEK